MSSILEAGADIFASLSSQKATMTVLAQTALSRGTERYAAGDIDGALQDFQRALALDPVSDNALMALDLMGQTHLGQGETNKAMAAYEKAIELSPTSVDPHLKRGNILFTLGRYGEAFTEYRYAQRLEPTNHTAIMSVGQAAMGKGDLVEAEARFRQFVGLQPRDPEGYHALGQVLGKRGRERDAITAFERAIQLDHRSAAARVDLGIILADGGDRDRAQDQLTLLKQLDPKLAPVLEAHLTATEKPRLLAVYSPDGRFDTNASVGTAISSLDSELATANANAVFEMKFFFSKTMDANSVQDVSKWSIGRAPLSSPGGGYNWGRTQDPSDAAFSNIPLSVVYDPDSLTATVVFLVHQNSDASGTLDPEHIVFRFRGLDAYGNAMDEASDEFSGILGVA